MSANVDAYRNLLFVGARNSSRNAACIRAWAVAEKVPAGTLAGMVRGWLAGGFLSASDAAALGVGP